MDAILGDRVEQERLFRPATLTYALDNYPRLIRRMKQKRLQISSTTIIRGKKFYRLHDKLNRHEKWVILETDFNLCRDIAVEIKLRTFLSYTHKQIEENIRALIRVSFSDRPF